MAHRGRDSDASTSTADPLDRERIDAVRAWVGSERDQQVHRVACLVQSALDRIVLPTAAVAREVTRRSIWKPVGYSRPGDYAREELGRSGSWLRDLGELGDALQKHPSLAAVLCGADGGRPLGHVATRWIGQMATPESLASWIEVARANSIASLRRALRRAKQADSKWPQPCDAEEAPAVESPRGGEPPAETPPAGNAPAETLQTAPPRAETPPAQTPRVQEGQASAGPPDTREATLDLSFLATHFVDEELEEQFRLRMRVPKAVRAAFDEVLDLHRAVVGHEASISSFVEALVAESEGFHMPEEIILSPVRKPSVDRIILEEALNTVHEKWKDELEARIEASRALDDRTWFRQFALEIGQRQALSPELEHAAGLAVRTLSHLQSVADRGGEGDFDEVAAQLRSLVLLESELRARLGSLLAAMDEETTWDRLHFACLAHYGEEVLGIKRSEVESMAWLARRLRTLPLLRAAYERGQVRFESSLLVCRALGRGCVTREDESAWVERANISSVKRMRDELRHIRRKEALAAFEGVGESAAGQLGAPLPSFEDVTAYLRREQGAISGYEPCDRPRRRPPRVVPRPLSDAEWHASLERRPGDALRRVAQLGLLAAVDRHPDVWMTLGLPRALAEDLAAAIEKWRRLIEVRVTSVPPDEPWHDEGATPAMVAARLSFVDYAQVPIWVGLLALLEVYGAQWDHSPQREGDPIYRRDGFRCMAPGCTSRCNLEDHHVHYRSHGGNDDLCNQLCLCAFHHRQGEHGRLASCRGKAPLEVIWRLGRPEVGVSYRNELKLGTVADRAERAAA